MKKNTKLFYDDALIYNEASKLLLNEETVKAIDEQLIVPIIYLLRHSLELSLKAHLFKYLEENTLICDFCNFKLYDKSGNKLPKDKLLSTHSIKKLFECMIFFDKQRLFPLFDANEIKNLKNGLQHIMRLDDKSDYFRYPLGKQLKKHKRTFISEYSITDDFCVPELKTKCHLLISKDNKKMYVTNHLDLFIMPQRLNKCVELLLSRL